MSVAEPSEHRQPRRRRSDKETPVIIPTAPIDSPFIFGFCEDRNASRRRKMEVKIYQNDY